MRAREERSGDKHKWFWRVVLLLATALNGWQWHEHSMTHRPVAAVIDVVFAILSLAGFFYTFRR
jgi:hypothetical protein